MTPRPGGLRSEPAAPGAGGDADPARSVRFSPVLSRPTEEHTGDTRRRTRSNAPDASRHGSTTSITTFPSLRPVSTNPYASTIRSSG